jgi:hypothetical protein
VAVANGLTDIIWVSQFGIDLPTTTAKIELQAGARIEAIGSLERPSTSDLGRLGFCVLAGVFVCQRVADDLLGIVSCLPRHSGIATLTESGPWGDVTTALLRGVR